MTSTLSTSSTSSTKIKQPNGKNGKNHDDPTNLSSTSHKKPRVESNTNNTIIQNKSDNSQPQSQSVFAHIEKNRNIANDLAEKIKNLKGARDLNLQDLHTVDTSVHKLKQRLDLIKSQEKIRKLELEYNQCLMNHRSVIIQLSEKRSRMRSLNEQVKTARENIDKITNESVSTKKNSDISNDSAILEIQFVDNDGPDEPLLQLAAGYTGEGESQAA